MSFTIEGRTDGGQYWHAAEFEVGFTVDEHRSVTVTVTDTVGAVRDQLVLTADAAQELRSLLLDARDKTTATSVRGLETGTLRWVLGGDTDEVRLDAQFEQISDWLTYALGREPWDWSNGNDTWEY